jgi:hypothetical protein
MEAIFSSETSVDFQQTTRRYIQEESTPQRRLMFQRPFIMQIYPTYNELVL